MTYVITENCIKCKFTDCVDSCPVDCFHEGPDMLVIDPDECIHCDWCNGVCPSGAIYEIDDLPEGQKQFAEINETLSKQWPLIKSSIEWRYSLDDKERKEKESWIDVPGKLRYLGINITEEDHQTGLSDNSPVIRVRSIKLIKKLSAVEVESLLTDADVSVRLAILKRNDFTLNEKQIASGLTDLNPEVQLACLQRED